METPIFQVDAFNSQPFHGNPAGVCLLTSPQPDEWMANVAREMNLSETAFLLPEGDAYRLRWFTPAVEVDLCGHATLASSHILWETGKAAPTQELRFNTRSGLLTARRVGSWIELNFPVTPVEPAPAPAGLEEILGAKYSICGKSIYDYFVELDNEETLRTLKPDFQRLKTVPARGVIVTSRASTPGFDFVSRFFGSPVGIDEDPVTGSAHCALAPYWSGRLGKTSFDALQVSARTGILRVHLDGERVRIQGQAVTVIKGTLVW